MEKEHPDDYITVVLPEFVVKHWWHHLLHNQSALTLKAALLFRPRVIRRQSRSTSPNDARGRGRRDWRC